MFPRAAEEIRDEVIGHLEDAIGALSLLDSRDDDLGAAAEKIRPELKALLYRIELAESWNEPVARETCALHETYQADCGHCVIAEQDREHRETR